MVPSRPTGLVAAVLGNRVILAVQVVLVMVTTAALVAAVGIIAAVAYAIRYHLTTGRRIRAMQKRQGD